MSTEGFMRTLFKKRILVALLGAGLSIPVASCGTLLYPERRGQPSGPLDPGIVLLDAAGLVLFFVPGIIAFAVDFTTGAIYLPHERAEGPLPVTPAELRTVRMSPAELTPERLETVIRDNTGQTIRLQPGAYRATRLRQLDDFSSDAVQRLESSPGVTNVAFPQTKN
jgi:hypothetical protein